MTGAKATFLRALIATLLVVLSVPVVYGALYLFTQVVNVILGIGRN